MWVRGDSSRPEHDIEFIWQFYNILEVDRSASDVIIKKAFRKQAMKHHPDRGGDAEKVTGTKRL